MALAKHTSCLRKVSARGVSHQMLLQQLYTFGVIMPDKVGIKLANKLSPFCCKPGPFVLLPIHIFMQLVSYLSECAGWPEQIRYGG